MTEVMSIPNMADLTPKGIIEAFLELPDSTESLFPQPENQVLPLNTFTVFPGLPPELRLKIWRLLFPRARRIPLRQCAVQGFKKQPGQASSKRRLLRPIKIPHPITLRINRESRDETLISYRMLFPTQTIPILPFPEDELQYPAGYEKYSLCFNPKKDILYLSAGTFYRKGHLALEIPWLQFLSTQGFLAIRNLDISTLVPHYPPHPLADNGYVRRFQSGLEKVSPHLQHVEKITFSHRRWLPRFNAHGRHPLDQWLMTAEQKYVEPFLSQNLTLHRANAVKWCKARLAASLDHKKMPEIVVRDWTHFGQ